MSGLHESLWTIKNMDSSGTYDRSTDSLEAISTKLSHVPKFTGEIWYVRATGSDTDTGLSPDHAFATIGHAIDSANATDMITVEAGTYDETGLDVNKAALELHFEAGAFVVNSAPGTCLIVSGAAAIVNRVHVVQAGGIGIQITGIGVILRDCIAVNCTIGFDINEHSTQLFNCISAGHTVTGFDIGERNTVGHHCYAAGLGAATRGFYFSSSVVTRCLFEFANSIGNATAGFEIIADAKYNSITKATTGGGDGAYIDNGEFNMWDIIDTMPREFHEDVYPKSDGAGSAVVPINVINTATDDTPDSRDDRYYWGNTKVIIPPNTITKPWWSVGLYIFAVTAADLQQFETYYTTDVHKTVRAAGNGWDLGEVTLTVADASKLAISDWVWIKSDSHPNGEILQITNIVGAVLTVVSEVRASTNTGIRYNHVANETLYVIKRLLNNQLHGHEGAYSASGARDWARISWTDKKRIPANGAMIIRMYNGTDDSVSSFDVQVIYED